MDNLVVEAVLVSVTVKTAAAPGVGPPTSSEMICRDTHHFTLFYFNDSGNDMNRSMKTRPSSTWPMISVSFAWTG